MPDIKLRNVTKRWGDVTAVNNFNLTIEDGSFMCFLGPSGCGKTTILRMIAGLEEPTVGKMYMGDRLIFSSEKAFSLDPSMRDVGLIFQSYALWPHMTVFKNIAFGLEMEKKTRTEIKKRVNDIADLMDIGNLLERYPSELSGGQQQRVALARSLATQPSCLLMDEPLSNLDAKLRVDMRTELKRIHSETKQTIIYVTHDQLEALSLGTHVVVMNNGKLQQCDKPMELYRTPKNLFVGEFVGTPRINMLSGKFVERNGQMCFQTGELLFLVKKIKGIRVGQEVTLAVRPEDIKLKTSADNGRFSFTVYTSLPTGADIYTRIRHGQLYLTVRQEDKVIYPPETEVGIDFENESVLIYDSDTRELIGKTSFINK